MKKVLTIHLDSPMQSWDIESRYRHRHAGEAPSKSAICGMLCAAMGAGKASEEEARIVAGFTHLRMIVYALSPRKGRHTELLRDYHTVLGTRNAEGKLLKHAILTERYYLQDKRFVVMLESDDTAFLEQCHHALLYPVWGIWLGRKCCIPAAPLVREELAEPADARDALRASYPQEEWDHEIFEEVADFSAGTDTWHDQPVSFGQRDSSGREGREWAPRRIRHGLGAEERARRISHVEILRENDFFQGF